MLTATNGPHAPSNSIHCCCCFLYAKPRILMQQARVAGWLVQAPLLVCRQSETRLLCRCVSSDGLSSRGTQNNCRRLCRSALESVNDDDNERFTQTAHSIGVDMLVSWRGLVGRLVGRDAYQFTGWRCLLHQVFLNGSVGSRGRSCRRKRPIRSLHAG